jgi:hypothetical protein
MMAERMDGRKINDELEQLQLEETRERVQQIRSKRATRQRRMESRERSFTEQRRREAISQAGCVHRKGGKGVEGRYQGNDTNYAVIKHTLCHGPTLVICQRCFKIWSPPPPELNSRKASSEEKKLYRQLYEQYVAALNFPTDNEPSGTQLFVITRDEAA